MGKVFYELVMVFLDHLYSDGEIVLDSCLKAAYKVVRFGRGSALLFLVSGCLVVTKPFTQSVVINDCIDTFSAARAHDYEASLIDTGHSSC